MRNVAVVVVGGGPAGLGAAYTLSRAGLEVIVLDAQDQIGERAVCSGVIGEEAFTHFDLPSNSVVNHIHCVRAISAAGRTLEYQSDRPLARTVDKRLFNQELAQRARSAGSEIFCGRIVRAIEPQKDYVMVRSSRSDGLIETLTAEVALIATGVSMSLTSKLGLTTPAEFLQGMQSDIRLGVDGCSGPTEIFVGRDIAPGAFGWKIPLGNGLFRVGLMTTSDPRPYFAALLNRVAPAIDQSTIRSSRKAISQMPRGNCTGDRVIAIGEAAGHIKTSTGGGIYYGLLSAEMAADVVLRALKRGRPTIQRLGEFERLWRSALGFEIRMGFVGRKIMARASDSVMEAAFEKFARIGLIPSLNGSLRFDWHSRAILTSIGHLLALRCE
jgi:digeranylgeranylglycerophospholipid reductase